jgi:hypothetical protein
MELATTVFFQKDGVAREHRWWAQSIEVPLLPRNLRHLLRYKTVVGGQLKDALQTGWLSFGARMQPPHYVARICGLDPLSVSRQYVGQESWLGYLRTTDSLHSP